MNYVDIDFRSVCVIGLGYVGLPAALLSTIAGHSVVGVDVNMTHLDSLRSGSCRFSEPGLQELLQKSVSTGRLSFSSKPVASNIYVVAVPTPITEDCKPDLSYVMAATESIVPVLRRGDLVIIESTVPPGCCRNVVAPILDKTGLKCGKDYFLAYCPERVLPGKALHEIVHNARIVGGFSNQDSLRAQSFYATFVKGDIHLAGMEEAELIKLAENAYRDVNIAFANEIANICDQMNVEAAEVIVMANAHPRVNILNPGPGVGGHCIAVDPWFLIDACAETPLLKAARHVNNSRPAKVVKKITAHFAGKVAPKILLLGLSYKANVGDIRESPSIEIFTALKAAGMEVLTLDPHVSPCDSPSNLRSVEEVAPHLSVIDGLVVLVDHAEFLDLDFAQWISQMRGDFLLDARGRPQALGPTYAVPSLLVSAKR